MKKIVLFISLIIITFLFEAKIKREGKLFYSHYIFGQTSICNVLTEKDSDVDSSIISNKEKVIYSYNPPKAYLGICIVCIIMFFVVSGK